jgi:hypothetical protein
VLLNSHSLDGRLRIALVPIFLLSATFLLAIGQSPTAEAATWTVDDGGSGDFTKLIDAFRVAEEGDTILLSPGSYGGVATSKSRITIEGDGDPESIHIGPLLFKESTTGNTIRGVSPEYVVIQGGSHVVDNVMTDRVHISGGGQHRILHSQMNYIVVERADNNVISGNHISGDCPTGEQEEGSQIGKYTVVYEVPSYANLGGSEYCFGIMTGYAKLDEDEPGTWPSSLPQFRSDGNTISGNIIEIEQDCGRNACIAILMNNGYNNRVTGNAIIAEGSGFAGIYIGERAAVGAIVTAGNTEIAKNYIAYTTAAVTTIRATDVVVYENNFIENDADSFGDSGITWHKNGKGNYWEHFALDLGVNDADDDGIIDRPYLVTGDDDSYTATVMDVQGVDRYPLVDMVDGMPTPEFPAHAVAIIATAIGITIVASRKFPQRWMKHDPAG